MVAIEELPSSILSASSEEKIMVPLSDEMIEKSLGTFGWNEFVQCVLVSFAMFFDAQQSFITIYTDDYPKWHCIDSTVCTTSSNICKIPKSSWSWNGPSHKTIISQWGLECASSFVTGLPQSSFFVGCLCGSFLLETLADTSLGRKNMLILSRLSMSITSVLIFISTNVWIYSAFKFGINFFRASIETCALALLNEKMSTEWRLEWRFIVGIVAYFCFPLGYMSLPGIAYANRYLSWKSVYVWTSIPAICYSIIAYIFVTESPRWLLMQGSHQEAMEMLNGVSSAKNGVDFSVSLLKPPEKQKASVFQLYSSIVKLFGRIWAVKRTVTIMVLGTSIGMVCISMPLAVGNLGFDIYLAVVFYALMEIPSCVATYFLKNQK